MKSGKELHFFHKSVRIFLKSTVLSTFAKIFRIPFNEVCYKHKLIANSKEIKHPNDAKSFGPCSSITSWVSEEKQTGFVIRWILKNGVLKVFHTIISDNEFKLFMSFTNKKGVEVCAIKVYDRHPFTEKDICNIKKQKEYQYLNGKM